MASMHARSGCGTDNRVRRDQSYSMMDFPRKRWHARIEAELAVALSESETILVADWPRASASPSEPIRSAKFMRFYAADNSCVTVRQSTALNWAAIYERGAESGGFQRCGRSSSTRDAGWSWTRVSTSAM